MDITVAAQTDVGRVRLGNEDAHFADPDLGLFIVCDGMGGHNAGEVASQAGCDLLAREISRASRLRERFLATGAADDAEALRKMLETAMGAVSREIYKRASRTPELAGMGTTCTLVLLASHHKALLAHVGDSRLYVYRGGRLHQLSEDHTYVNDLVRRGSITREQAQEHPQSNVLSRALGVQSEVAVETMVFDVDPGDTYLLCTDGLHNYFASPKELYPGLSALDLRAGLALLVRIALERGGHDNVTGVAFRIGGRLDAREAAVAAERRITLLKRIGLFSQLSYDELVRVVGLTRLARAAPGQVIVREGDRGGELYVVLGGEVDVERAGRPLATHRSGYHFGELTMLESKPRPATVRARTAVHLLVARRVEFLGLIQSQPVIAAKLLWSFLRELSGRSRATPGTKTPGAETPGAETPGTETPATETPATETPATETPGAETPATETPDGLEGLFPEDEKAGA